MTAKKQTNWTVQTKRTHPSKHSFAYLSLLAGMCCLFVLILFAACRKEVFTTNVDDVLVLQADTITFDTVFTTLGSTTASFKIFNEHAQHLRVSDVRIAGGENSPFRMNLDGIEGWKFEDVELNPRDSLYLFIEVTIDPDDNNLPFLVEDSILLLTNGVEQKVHLVAYGQNAVFFNNVEVCDEILTDELPYVFYNIVYVPPNCALTLQEGVDVFVHRNARFIIEGTLNINGTRDSMVSFQGSRLESYFDDLSAQWTGIELLRNSRANVNYAHLKNGVYGFVMGSLIGDSIGIADYTSENVPVLQMNNSIISNCFLSGITGFLSVVLAENSLIYDCGLHNLELTYGGIYWFTHCTFANYGTVDLSHRDPILNVSNVIAVGDGMTSEIYSAPTDLYLGNCIVYGSGEEELSIANQLEGAAELNYLFENCLLKTERNIDTLTFIDCVKNPVIADTMFIDRLNRDYHLHPLSPAIDIGSSNLNAPFTPSLIDYDGNPKNADVAPDAGAFEFVP